jgi:hypothetical protein
MLINAVCFGVATGVCVCVCVCVYTKDMLISAVCFAEP